MQTAPMGVAEKRLSLLIIRSVVVSIQELLSAFSMTSNVSEFSAIVPQLAFNHPRFNPDLNSFQIYRESESYDACNSHVAREFS